MTPNTNGLKMSTPDLFGALMDSFPDMIHSVDEQGNIVFFNSAAPKLLGYTEAELSGMNIRQLYPPEIMEAVEKGFLEVKQTGEKVVESLFMAKDGKRIPVEIRTLAIRDDQGAFAQTFSISRDIRRLKEMQDGMLHAGRLAAIGELAAGVAHDINNPLTAVSLAVSMLQQVLDNQTGMKEDVRNQATELLVMIAESTSTMEHISTRLRDFSRGVRDQHAPVDLFDPINDALFILGHQIATKGVQPICSAVKARCWTYGDRNQLEQVFLNLFANACDAMAEREVRELYIDIAPDAKDGRNFWHCTVRDTGTGIKPEDREQVFKAFYTTKPRGKGTGLGLSIARSILTEHGGKITLESEYGQGATFSLWFPAYLQRMPFAKANDPSL